jgi:hypothetical protein
VEDQELVDAVKIAKRHPEYRERRSQLSSVTPKDVWADAELSAAIVTFDLPPADELSFEGYLAFTVDLGNREVRDVAHLSLGLEEGGWRVLNTAVAESSAAGQSRCDE